MHVKSAQGTARCALVDQLSASQTEKAALSCCSHTICATSLSSEINFENGNSICKASPQEKKKGLSTSAAHTVRLLSFSWIPRSVTLAQSRAAISPASALPGVPAHQPLLRCWRHTGRRGLLVLLSHTASQPLDQSRCSLCSLPPGDLEWKLQGCVFPLEAAASTAFDRGGTGLKPLNMLSV